MIYYHISSAQVKEYIKMNETYRIYDIEDKLINQLSLIDTMKFLLNRNREIFSWKIVLHDSIRNDENITYKVQYEYQSTKYTYCYVSYPLELIKKNNWIPFNSEFENVIKNDLARLVIKISNKDFNCDYYAVLVNNNFPNIIQV